jgi:hypothetical protein
LKKSDLKIIVGGLSAPSPALDRRFLSAFVTNTRLMGVVGLYMNWELETRDGFTSMHQYYYYDAEEYGFETYKSIYGNNVTELAIVEQTLIGGLGGSKIDLLEEEACLLVQLFAEANRTFSLDLPGKKEEYEFILSMDLDNRDALTQVVMDKMCGPLESGYQVINYFLMRCFARDFVAAEYLTTGGFNLDLFPEYVPSTLCKNTIKKLHHGVGNRFSCESLVEENGKYDLLFTEVEIADFQIQEYERTATLTISPQEAGMLLARPEFVTLYEIVFDPVNFDDLVAEATERAMVTIHPNGKLYLAFNKNNDHVHKREYRLNDDVYGIYYVSDYGQMIVASYSKQGIRSIEESLKKSSLNHYLLETNRFEFKEPVLYEFVNSDFDDFEDFVDVIRED